MANQKEQRIINAAIAVAKEYLYIHREEDGQLKGPWTWLDKGPDDPMVELCFAIQDAIDDEDVSLGDLPESE